MKTYTIVGGVNGCGKSSLTGVLKSLEPNMGIIIDPDDIAKKSNLSSYEVGRKTIEKIQKCLSENIKMCIRDSYYLVIADETGLQMPQKEEFQIDIAFAVDEFNFFN